MIKRFKEILLQSADLSMDAQKEFITNYFDEWKGSKEQVDDVLLLGIQIP